MEAGRQRGRLGEERRDVKRLKMETTRDQQTKPENKKAELSRLVSEAHVCCCHYDKQK